MPAEPDQRSPAVDHPAPLGPLAPIFQRRNIAVGEGRDGAVLLIRPDSVVVDVPREAPARKRFDKFVKRNRAMIREAPVDERLGFVIVEPPGQEAAMIRGEQRWSLDAVNRLVNDARAVELSADYNHVIIGAQSVKGSPLGAPATWAGDMAFMGQTIEADDEVLLLTLAEPSAQPPVLRPRLDLAGHTAPRVLILDTGLRTVPVDPAATTTAGGVRGRPQRLPEHPELASINLQVEWKLSDQPGIVDDEDEPFDPTPAHAATPVRADGTSVLDFEAGHGTFIAGIIRQICPDAVVTTKGVLSSFGDGDVAGVLAAFAAILDAEGPFDIVVMSFGANLVGDEPGAFGRGIMTLLGDALGIAAAGNQSTCRPYFPAALTDVIGVGGLAADGKAWFTNFGGWVDACAPAIDVTSTFFCDFTETIKGEEFRRYEQWARWSGTSFAAPKVAAVIAQEMYLYGVTAKEAWKRLTSHRSLRVPDLGVVFNV
jgi:hypothetical protein